MYDAREYPQFGTGDTLVVAPTGKTWKLHSQVLVNSSKVLGEILRDAPAVHLTKSDIAKGKLVRFRLEMTVSHVTDRFAHFMTVVSIKETSHIY